MLAHRRCMQQTHAVVSHHPWTPCSCRRFPSGLRYIVAVLHGCSSPRHEARRCMGAGCVLQGTSLVQIARPEKLLYSRDLC
ncbi:hypothetical protein IE81DRAFT_141310 [Ceraceosorus guamensis]|uniref:Uncharacterized protein n=1 Tax=Ceraceosorus guamensis TaxID=1522189 RepID=A0A316W109_9BASI|nr:hypothetical protein IE81DRAFT_141310 [Ceraceosorus guamensis]PWN42241.1 hypothetical protein IE81DRAFT_141310 [Ceraceosorus guamensis]